MKGEKAIDLIFDELAKAELKHPSFPKDPIHMAAIMAEEAGEAVKASIDMVYHSGNVADLMLEVAQTGAMAIRILMQFEEFDL